MKAPRYLHRICLLCLCILSGCTSVGPDYNQKQATLVPNAPQTWQETLPHGGDPQALKDWWAQFNDPLLTELIEAAQTQSASIATAALRIAQARALNISANAQAVPNVTGAASSTRGTLILGEPILIDTTSQAQLQASWEIDLFGGVRRRSESTLAKLDAEIANWHSARISVAAEMANLYTNYRGCEQQVELSAADVLSREQTAALSAKLGDAGFQSSANVALARASAAEGTGRLVTQRAECDIHIKGMVALTGMTESGLREQLKNRTAKLPRPEVIAISAIPAQILAQRPDVAAAERELASANADIGARIAERFPRIMLLGNIGPLNFSTTDLGMTTSSWSFGPTVTLPIFDAGRLAANVETARVAYQTSETNYRQRVRSAVREVEEALVRLNSMEMREKNGQIASDGYHESLHAAEQRWQSGLASQLELEETRRLSFNADLSLVILKRDHVNAWIALYRAVGGGWEPKEWNN
jgi:NodT family efflux transporter outer membrane factor (OMF) lipoprotein